MKKNNRVLLQVPGTYGYLAATILLGTLLGGFIVAQAYYLLLAGVGVPLLTYLLSRKLGQHIIAARSALRLDLVDSIQGVADLLAFNQEQVQIQKAGRLNRQLVRLQAGMACIGGLREALGIVLVDGCAWTMLFIAIPQRSSLLVLERSEVVKSCLYHRFNPFDRTPLRFVRVV